MIIEVLIVVYKTNTVVITIILCSLWFPTETRYCEINHLVAYIQINRCLNLLEFRTGFRSRSMNRPSNSSKFQRWNRWSHDSSPITAELAIFMLTFLTCFRLLLETCNLFHRDIRSSVISGMSPDVYFRDWSDKFKNRARSSLNFGFWSHAMRRPQTVRYNCVLWACNRWKTRPKWKETIFHAARGHLGVEWYMVNQAFLGCYFIWRKSQRK